MAGPQKKIRVDQAELRKLYARHIDRHVQSKRYTLIQVRSGIPQYTNLPAGTQSAIYDVHDHNGNKVATVHAYILPDGSLGASGKYDPKAIRVGGRWYYV
jgi:hypothetical protein